MWKPWKEENDMSRQVFNFDEVIDRRGTHCGKWDTMDEK